MAEIGRTKRIAALMLEIPETLKPLESNLPKQIDGYALSPNSKLPWKVMLYREALIWRIVELSTHDLRRSLSIVPISEGFNFSDFFLNPVDRVANESPKRTASARVLFIPTNLAG